MISSRPARLLLRRSGVMAGIVAFSFAGANAGAQVTLSGFTIDCGGQVSTGGTLRLTSAIGQPDSGGVLSSGSTVLIGGFLTPRACRADFDQNGAVTIDDIFIFLNAWFAGCNGAIAGAPCFGRSCDIDSSGMLSIDDIFIFLNVWFAGC